MCALQRIPFKATVVNPMSLSQYSTYHNAPFRMNFHMTPHVSIEVSNSFKLGNSFSSSVAKRYVDALSDIIIRGSDF